VQVWSGASGASGNWDNHGNIANELPPMALATDKPCAALVKDLKARGMLDDLYALHKHAFRACKALGKAAERLEAREQQHIRLREGGAPVGALEHSTKKRKIGLDDDDEPRPTEARAELGDMETGAKPEDRDDRLVAEIDRLGEIDRFLAGCMP